VFGCNVSTACNFNENATVNDGSCDFASCFNNDVEGCTNPMACNFDGEATLNDGSCDFTSCADMGCTDANACNYDVTATIRLVSKLFSPNCSRPRALIEVRTIPPTNQNQE